MIRNECSVCEELWQKIGELRDENDNLRIEVG